jgi:hypothetical protein
LQTGATSTSHQASPLAAAAAAAPPASRYKYKYPEAYPTPPGEDDEKWNKIFTAADSRLYNRHGKSAVESKKYRTSGETYKLALQMLAEKNAKEAAIAAGGMLTPFAYSFPFSERPGRHNASLRGEYSLLFANPTFSPFNQEN